MNAKEALRNIKREKPTFFSTLYDSDMWEEDIGTIEKELKALEIIKRDLDAFISLCVFVNGFNTYEEWEETHPNCFTREEIELLNEVLVPKRPKPTKEELL